MVPDPRQEPRLSWGNGCSESEERGDSSSSDSDSSEDTGSKLQLLRDELAKAEAKAKRKEAKAEKKRGKEPKEKAKGKKPDKLKEALRSNTNKKQEKKGKKKKKGKGVKKRKKEVSSEGSEEAEELFQPRGPRNEDDAKGSKARGDRGPFGCGPEVNFLAAADGSEESGFREAPSTSKRSSQLTLVKYAQEHPGRLASRLLLKMEAANARDGEGAKASPCNKTPAAATHYFLTTLQPQLGPKLNMRSQRELRTLSQLIDLLAVGKVGQADVIAQRMKAVEKATLEGHWNSAQFLELIAPEGASLLGRDEEVYLARKCLLDQRPYDRAPWKPDSKGKGKEKGQGKDRKSKSMLRGRVE